ncbi:hypothetical protein EYF80_053796 [Liparis tanakae]|uniref:Uncharacterized protein n=1 Tax=Liparis tanakae TaxID=230148 RepID=A0A4Z2F6E8_9TELE|nr:hypothetical protein EYF80_053796 [Liparis tanakae]
MEMEVKVEVKVEMDMKVEMEVEMEMEIKVEMETHGAPRLPAPQQESPDPAHFVRLLDRVLEALRPDTRTGSPGHRDQSPEGPETRTQEPGSPGPEQDPGEDVRKREEEERRGAKSMLQRTQQVGQGSSESTGRRRGQAVRDFQEKIVQYLVRSK